MAMSLDGLRAWIGVVERKLTMRTRVFLVLVAIAVGGAAAGIVLAIDAGDEAITKSDLETVRDELGAGGATAQPGVEELEAKLSALEAEVAELKAAGGSSGGGGNPGTSGGGTTTTPSQSAKQLQEALEKAKEQAGK
jgi:hypothetical protein